MAVKVTTLFQVQTTMPNNTPGKTAGFSETVYSLMGFNTPELLNAHYLLMEQRAKLLPRTASIIGQRYMSMETTGASKIAKRNYPGSSGADTDIPSMAVSYRLQGTGVPNRVNLIIRGIPDTMATKGSFSPTPNFAANIQGYMNELSNNWYFHGRDQMVETAEIILIAADGTIDYAPDIGLTAGEYVQVLDTKSVDGKGHGGFYWLADSETDGYLRLRGWIGLACEGGKIRPWGEVYAKYPNETVDPYTGTIMNRKVGRPFFSYRGRAAAVSQSRLSPPAAMPSIGSARVT